MFKMLFWPGSFVVMIAGFVFGGVVLGFHVGNTKSLKVSGALVALFLLVNISLFFVRSHQIFAAFSSFDSKEMLDGNFYYWSQYSWLLYIAGEEEKALDANEKLRVMVCEGDSEEIYLGFEERNRASYCQELQQRETQIKTKTWGNRDF